MKIVVVNGNTTAGVTASIERTARRVALPGTDILAVTPSSGPSTVEGYLDGQQSALGVCEAIAAHQQDGDAFVIACFSDPGLYAARELSRKPVVGIAEASMLTAIQLGRRFGLLTPQRRLRPVLEGLVQTYGLWDRLAGVRVVDESVASLAAATRNRTDVFLKAALHSLVEDGAEVLILAGAVLSDLETELGKRLTAPILDPIKCAVMQAQSLVHLGLQTSRECGFAYPLQKDCLNCPPEIDALAYQPR